jgi:cardiolipin synthase (CMP-forming)
MAGLVPAIHALLVAACFPHPASLAAMMSGLELNLPNSISLGRLLLVPVAAWLIIHDRCGVAFWVLVAAGVSDALDGFVAKRFDRRTRFGAVLDPAADKAMLVSVYIALGVTQQVLPWLVFLIVFRDAMIVGGFLLIQAIAAPKDLDPLYISKINTGVQIIFAGFVLARAGLGLDPGWSDFILSFVVAATTISSGLSYVVRWARSIVRPGQVM